MVALAYVRFEFVSCFEICALNFRTGRIAELLAIPSSGYDGPKFLWY